MINDLMIIIIVVFMAILLATYFGSNLSKKEGLTSSTASSSSGEAGLSTGYAEEIKSKAVEIQDTLLISKYRKEYEASLINLDDYVGMLMLKQALNLKLDGGKEMLTGLDALNILKTAKDNLNVAMEYLDKQ